jgi:DNA-binding MarR family transcriptional regulator
MTASPSDAAAPFESGPSVRPESATRLASEAWEALLSAQVALVRRFAADDVWGELGMREYDVLLHLSRRPGQRARLWELHREVLLSQPSLSRMVDRLAAAGLVARAADPADRRGTVVVLTEAGAEAQRRIGLRHATSIRRHLKPALDDEELRTLRDLCTRLRAAAAR